eukprot:TRINITY_DN12935_c0_g1_i1.p1 TRINITY_DN12935_c0_g1~~TRINITY_DN12935_c0_g1_i1.p1  ORF type:complete len:321 (-),score=62.26 TRINITY_DN12935_c0_g1_i1:281-1243(-)
MLDEMFWNEVISANRSIGPFPSNAEQFIKTALSVNSSMLSINSLFRKARNKPEGYFYGNFVCEGRVIFFLSRDGTCDREMVYKIKPWDFQLNLHNLSFSSSIQVRATEALMKIFKRGLTFSDISVMREMDMNEIVWTKMGSEIMKFLGGIPDIWSPNYRASKQKMLIMVGTPGSGKSTIANCLVDKSQKQWRRVNQDEMGTRKACELQAKQFFKKGYNLIVDRCNFDLMQRNVWVKLATQFNCNYIICLYLKIPASVCKERLGTRTGHPTIKDAALGAKIIDNFAKDLVPPVLGEGFTRTITVTNDEEVNDAIKEILHTT